MPKIHNKNGFEYHCERYFELVTWYRRPVGQPVFLPFSGGGAKTLKKDLEAHLSDPIAAAAAYEKQLRGACDVERAEKEYREAVQALERRTDPEQLPLRGSNPDRDARRGRDAEGSSGFSVGKDS